MKVNIDIPDSLAEITLGQYQEWLNVIGTDEAKAMKMIQIFCKLPVEVVVKLKYTDMVQIVEHLNQLFSATQPLVNRFHMNDVEYGFIPNFDEMTFGEFTDLEDNLVDWYQIHKAMYILYRPVTKSFGKYYSIAEYDGKLGTADIMKRMPLSAAMGSVNFILRLGTELGKYMLTCIEKEMELQQCQQEVHSLNATDGSMSTMHSVKVTLHALNQLVELTSMSHLHMPHTKQERMTLKTQNLTKVAHEEFV